jgi:hypothetical protein
MSDNKDMAQDEAGAAVSHSRRQRPNPAQWIWYLFGGRLPQRYREWVLHDVTCRTWWLRQIVRAIIQVLPAMLVLVLVFSFLHGPLWLTFMAPVLGLIVSTYYSLSYIVESCDGRLRTYGYPPQYGSQVRNEANAESRAASRARYNATWRNSPQ